MCIVDVRSGYEVYIYIYIYIYSTFQRLSQPGFLNTPESVRGGFVNGLFFRGFIHSRGDIGARSIERLLYLVRTPFRGVSNLCGRVAFYSIYPSLAFVRTRPPRMKKDGRKERALRVPIYRR